MARRYVEYPDFTMDPMAFVSIRNWPFTGDCLLKNDLWIREEQAASKNRAFTINKSGALPNGCALELGHARTLKQAILKALEIQPFEPLDEKRQRIEAAAQRDCDPELPILAGGLMDDCQHSFGPLLEEYRLRIMDYMDKPSAEAWDEIHGIEVCPRGAANTIWQFWILVDPSAPRMGPGSDLAGSICGEWDRIPSALEMLVILREAATRSLAEIPTTSEHSEE